MDLPPPRSWKLEFARSVDHERYLEIMRKVHDDARRERKRREDNEEEEDQQARLDDLLEMAVLATASEIETFQITIDRYDAATYDALVDNGELLTQLYRKRDEMLAKAYVLPDGRRVFESEDGLHVFDEFGKELDSTVVTPEEIEDWRPKSGSYFDNQDDIGVALQDRAVLADYHKKLDEARERAASGKITTDELKTIEKELADDMPDAVRERLAPEDRPPIPEPEAAIAPDPAAASFQPAPIHDAPTFL